MTRWLALLCLLAGPAWAQSQGCVETQIGPLVGGTVIVTPPGGARLRVGVELPPTGAYGTECRSTDAPVGDVLHGDPPASGSVLHGPPGGPAAADLLRGPEPPPDQGQ
ncbi:MAG: hypothetical protein J0H91_21795 [Rhodospirillales bacterium]|nr:hypothetical protein [Rhodospirillales bacterium]